MIKTGAYKSINFAFTLLFTVISAFSVAQHNQIQIELVKNDSLEIQTKSQLLKLLSAYDLRKWMYTNKIVIESGYQVIPHSHPVLTLNTRHLKDDDLLLSTFIHEQLHWFISMHPAKAEILKELRSTYPHPETSFPDGSGGEIDTYFHLVICHLEYQALIELLGELRAFQIISFWKQDHYKWIYHTILEDQRILHGLIKKYKIVPEG